ncbi:NAD-dependent epimerase/dehydratase family protein [Flagellimonas sp. GZD32]|uniref:NAD-dependent epimerase/dehydratase family protein n=1 Tax=Flagellimonas cixiensis TaxID=3228750 RepID=UPI0035C903F5
MNIFITGASGFIGSNLSRHLLDIGHTVHVGLRKGSNLNNLEDIKNRLAIYYYEILPGGLAQYFKQENIECVFHLASCFIAEHTTDQVEKLVDSNILFGTQLLEAMKSAKVTKLVNTGTSWQHYNNEPYNPTNLYAATKEAFEAILKYYTEAEGVNCITLKLFDSYSENDNRPKLINLLFKFSQEGRELDMSGGEQPINLLHVIDICKGFERALELLNDSNYNLNNGKYALAAKESITLKQLIKLFNKTAQNHIKVKWGAKPYRKREVMSLWSNYQLLPGWEQTIPLEVGLKGMFNR